MELGFQAITVLFIILSYLWTIWCLEMAGTNKDRKLVLILGRYLYAFVLIFIWFIQLIKHNTIIYWRIVELFK